MKIQVQICCVGQSTNTDPNLNTKRQERSGGWRLCGDIIQFNKTFIIYKVEKFQVKHSCFWNAFFCISKVATETKTELNE